MKLIIFETSLLVEELLSLLFSVPVLRQWTQSRSVSVLFLSPFVGYSRREIAYL